MTDFNDLHQSAGLATVRAAIEAAVAPADLSQTEPISEADEHAIARLATLSPIEYDRIRKDEAKRLNIREITLDKEVSAKRQEAKNDESGPLKVVEPWPEPVDGVQLLSEIESALRRFIICPPETAYAATLWIAMTWFMDVINVAPIAVITAPEKRCGKSQLLFLIGKLAKQALTASNITPAALFRAVELWRPTLLIDEADAFMKENEELRGLLNCGHTRESAYVVRTVGEDHMPKLFFVWGAKAIAGIGHLADTLMDRSISLELRRKLPSEQIDKLRYAAPDLFDVLAAKLARWSSDKFNAVKQARPLLPNTLHDRAQDNWEPLLAIADVAGGKWPILARQAALRLSGESEQGQSTGSELLADIQDVFETKRASRLFCADLLATLCDDEEKPWVTWNRGKPMTLRQLANRLREYDIASKQLRIGYESKKGFEASQFSDAFSRYLSVPPCPSETTKQINASKGLDVFDGGECFETNLLSETHYPTLYQGCFDVSDKKGGVGQQDDIIEEEL